MGQNIYICYNKKYLHEFIYSPKNLGGDFHFKPWDIVYF